MWVSETDTQGAVTSQNTLDEKWISSLKPVDLEPYYGFEITLVSIEPSGQFEPGLLLQVKTGGTSATLFSCPSHKCTDNPSHFVLKDYFWYFCMQLYECMLTSESCKNTTDN